MGGSGSAATKTGFAVHIYSCNTDMGDKAFVNSDGDFLIVPQQGSCGGGSREMTIQAERAFLPFTRVHYIALIAMALLSFLSLSLLPFS